ncbi:hypothetical protein [Streptomyces sp. MMBL 11-1]|uniref:hypothetical protein n=1 Tax=Streptomyces sp. MMBL 11-1 TaxID=3026420 RepID=UPI00235DF051|nr:hypothetical protein [Streptomyces sp. MMBL 11-1]
MTTEQRPDHEDADMRQPTDAPFGRNGDMLTSIFEGVANVLGYPFMLMLWPRVPPGFRRGAPREADRRDR